MAKKTEVFISYRRDPSADLARHIYDKLKSRGADVFLDVEAINGGRFEAIIEREIILRDYFLVLLTPDTLTSEWVRREIATALRHQKEIIPVSARGFNLATASLPSGLEELSKYDEIRYDTEYSEASINRIAIAINLNVKVNATLNMRALVGGLVIILGLLFGFFALFSEEWRNDFFYKIGFYTATPPALVQNATETSKPTLETVTLTLAPPTSTETPQPATQTPMGTTTPQPSLAPTNTPAPPTNASIASIAPITPAIDSDSIALTIFRDMDTLTLYMPQTDEQLSLAGLVFQVEIEGQNRQFPLIGYSSFGGNSILGDVSVLNSVACFRLIRNGSHSPAPMECQNGAMPLTQNVADADVFWYDSTANQLRTVLVLRDETTITVCATGQTECEVKLPIGQ